MKDCRPRRKSIKSSRRPRAQPNQRKRSPSLPSLNQPPRQLARARLIRKKVRRATMDRRGNSTPSVVGKRTLMSTQLISQAETIVEMIGRLPADSLLLQHGVGWDDYEELLEAVGEASSLRISFDDGTLQIMTLSQR